MLPNQIKLESLTLTGSLIQNPDQDREQFSPDIILRQQGLVRRAGIASLSTAGFLLAIKIVAWAESSSTSMLSSLLDTGFDFTLAVINYLTLRQALKPADFQHRWGHGKIEGLAALGQATFIFLGAVFLFLEVIDHIRNPVPLTGHFWVVGVSLVALLFTALLLGYQSYVIRQTNSLIIRADSQHYRSDFFINIGVIMAITADLWVALPWLDWVISLLICAYLVLSARHIAVLGLKMLLDHEVSAEMRTQISQAICSVKGVHNFHDLRTRQAGQQIFILVDIEVDPQQIFSEIHQITKEVEAAILEIVPGAEIMIHPDPIGEPHDSRHSVHEIHLADL